MPNSGAKRLRENNAIPLLAGVPAWHVTGTNVFPTAKCEVPTVLMLPVHICHVFVKH
jgi:hypothetical protein